MDDEVLSIKSGEFMWTQKNVQPVLEDIILMVRKGELVGILSRIGAGKVRCVSISDIDKFDVLVLLIE